MGNSPVRDITASDGGDDIAYIAVVNDEGQFAMWRADRRLPHGWHRRSAALPEADCLAFIESAWRDIRPASVPLTGQQAQQTSAAGRLTYARLAQSADRLASILRRTGVGPETLVGVCLERGIDVVRCRLAILKAGGAYLPLDPSLPDARLARMCAEVRPALIMTDRAALAFAGTVLVTGELDAAAAKAADEADAAEPVPESGPWPESLAYVIYTSGSAGQPKAVAVSHGSLASVISELTREYRMTGQDRVIQLASPGFDTSIEQMLVTLLSGATLMLPGTGTVAPTDLLSYPAEQRVTVIDLTPAYWHQLLAITEPGDRRLRSIRLMITGGDMAALADCAAAMRAAPGARLLNAYGLTETTITTTLFDASGTGPDWSGGGTGPVPVGRPIPQAQVLVLDDDLDEVPVGAVGEIYIGGRGVARGYLGKPAATAERFLPSPYSEVPGSRMYRSGDLGRWREDQELEVIGRGDRQLKVHGFRVDPAEIETVLMSHPDVHAAAVVAAELSPGSKQLVAYYTARHPGLATGGQPAGHAGDGSLRNYVAARLPGFMVPALY